MIARKILLALCVTAVLFTSGTHFSTETILNLILVANLLNLVYAIREQVDLKISAAMPSQQCQDTAFQRPCRRFDGSAIPDYYPADHPCPCPATADNSGAFIGRGRASTPNAYSDEFQDVVLADGFNNPVNVAFSNNGKFFVNTKSGQVWKVDRASGQKTLWLDITVRYPKENTKV
jgi:hypothetical protein